ncbi:hypothetical protein FXO37_19388 [Capsicum annuum]|nr:hypothetical protein FXO37_19388 [Capsicum annuum]
MPQDEDGMLGIMKMCVLKMERNYAKFTPLHNSKGHNLESYAKFMLSQLAPISTNSTRYLSPPTSNRYQITMSPKARADEKKSPGVYICWELNRKPHGAQPTSLNHQETTLGLFLSF